MSIADFYESGEQKQNKGHFRNLVMVAKADGVVDEDEMVLLKKIARRIGLSDDQFKAILESPEDYSINPPENKLERNERLFHLVEMVLADHDVEFSEMNKVRTYVVALGYPVELAEDIAIKATRTVIDGGDLDAMSEAVDVIVKG